MGQFRTYHSKFPVRPEEPEDLGNPSQQGIFDAEKTGTDPGVQDIIELAMIIDVRGKMVNEACWRMQPFDYDAITPEALQVHQITVKEGIWSLNRELSRRQQGSGRWNRTKQKLAKLHRSIANRRLDYQHKMTTEIASTYQVIGIEGLNVAGMLRNHYLALSIADAGFGEIRRQLYYKSEWYGGVLVEIDRFFPSSKLCRFCGCINSDLTLADRIWTCDCGAVLDRDRNAALNIERQALKMVAGVGSRRPKTHAEWISDSPEQSAMKRENMAEERQPSRLC